MRKYSEIRKKLHLNNGKHNPDDLAFFTHFLQNNSGELPEYLKENALNSYDHILETSNVSEPGFQYSLDIDWDVPFPPPDKDNIKFRFVDTFAGIGGFRIAFQKLGGKCVFSSEWDRHAQKTYEANFGEVPFGDITQINEELVPDHDIFLGGFPCQPFSIAGVSKKKSLGKEHGFLDETQGTLFYDIARIIKAKRPKAFLLENVKNLRSHDKGKTYKVIKEALKELNYITFDKIIDAKNFVPQHRERIFIAGFNRDYFDDYINFDFPGESEVKFSVKDILEAEPDPKYTLSDHLWTYLQNYAKKHRSQGNGFGFGLVDPEGITRTLSARYHKDGSEILIPQEGKNPRRLTPQECKRLMGYPEKFRIDNIGISDTQLYRQFGNSVVVPVVQSVANRMIEFIDSYKSINLPDKIPQAIY